MQPDSDELYTAQSPSNSNGQDDRVESPIEETLPRVEDELEKLSPSKGRSLLFVLYEVESYFKIDEVSSNDVQKHKLQ